MERMEFFTAEAVEIQNGLRKNQELVQVISKAGRVQHLNRVANVYPFELDWETASFKESLRKPMTSLLMSIEKG